MASTRGPDGGATVQAPRPRGTRSARALQVRVMVFMAVLRPGQPGQRFHNIGNMPPVFLRDYMELRFARRGSRACEDAGEEAGRSGEVGDRHAFPRRMGGG